MASSGVHYEVYLKSSRKDQWRLLEAHPERDTAEKVAQTLLKTHPAGSVRVSKETFDDRERVFRSFTVFEAGGEKYEDDGRADRKAELPCRSPTDLSSHHARQTITRALGGWLARQKALALELLHRVDLVEKLEASDTEMQHAIQKIAIAQAAETEASAQHFVKQINHLVQQAIEHLYAEHRAGGAAVIKPGELAAFAAGIRTAANRDHQVRGAITMRLKGAKDWKAKLGRLVDLADEAAVGGEEADWALDVVAEFIGEIAEIPAAREALLTSQKDLGWTLDALTNLVRGAAEEKDTLSPVGKRLAVYFKKNRCRDARVVLARHILKELNSPKRLNRDDIEAEVTLNRSLADRLITLTGVLFTPEEISEAFVVRSSRLLEPEAVESYLEAAENTGAALSRLIALEENIVGDGNKTKLASYVRAQLGAHGCERWFVYGKAPVLQRLSELASLRRMLDSSSFAQTDAAEIGEQIERLAVATQSEANVFGAIQARSMPPLDKAAAFLRLAAGGAFPPGQLTAEARARAMKLLASPEAKAQLTSGDESARAQAAEIAKLAKSLEKTGAAA